MTKRAKREIISAMSQISIAALNLSSGGGAGFAEHGGGCAQKGRNKRKGRVRKDPPKIVDSAHTAPVVPPQSPPEGPESHEDEDLIAEAFTSKTKSQVRRFVF